MINNQHKGASEDFFGCTFITETCPTCGTEYQRMEIDKKAKKCPKCDNKWSEDY